MKTDGTGNNVANIAEARKRKAQDDVAPLEAHGPTAIKVDGTDDWVITACDGEQVYVFTAVKKTKKSKTYTVTEVYPGLCKKRTDLRDATEQLDLLLLGKYRELSDVLEDIEEMMLGDLEFEDADVN